MVELYFDLRKKLAVLEEVPLLLIRLILAYGFYGPAMKKLSNIDGIAQWFGSINFPLPTLNAYLVTVTETAGFVLLFLGLGTRIISVPLMIAMLVAIFAVHFDGGFSAGNNGFEIPLYYLLMLFLLFIKGGGKISLDALVEKKFFSK